MEEIGRTLVGLCLGQLVSFAVAIAIFSASLITREVNAPLSMPFSSYFALAVVNGCIMLSRRQKLSVSWYWYALLGFIDVHGNFLANKALQFTSITSVTILDCWGIAWVMILTRIFLGAKYSPRQFVGVAICVSGLGLVLLSDAGVGGGGGSNPLFGDFLVILASLFYAMDNVGQEFCAKRRDMTELLTMFGLFGMIVSAPEIAVLEGITFVSFQWSTQFILAYGAYTVATFLFYTMTPVVLKRSGSTLFNLSILTADMWVVVFRIFFYKQKVDWLYYLAFAIVIFGICLYSESGKDHSNKQTVEDEEFDPEYRPINVPDDSNIRNEFVHSPAEQN